jgi:RNA ligase
MTKSMTSFPSLKDIDQVREAIKGRPEFFESEREALGYKYHVFNYMVGHTDSFDCPIRRECRGLIFDANGKVLSRRFHKFFNLGEKEETFADRIDWTQPHTIQEKMDGSMITPLVLDRGKRVIQWATKMGVTDIGEMARRFVANRVSYCGAAINAFDEGLTPIFEYVGPYNRIVLPYQHENLVLLSLRDNVTGEYLKPDQIEDFAKHHRIPVVARHTVNLVALKEATDIEGVVVAFDSGLKVKVKTEWYCSIHRAKDNILFEKNVLKLILEEKMDDVIPFLLDHDRKRVEDYRDILLKNIEGIVWHVDQILEGCHVSNIDRKGFALNIAPEYSKFIVSIVFATWGKLKSEIRQHVVKTYLKNTSSQTDVDSIREFIGTTWVPPMLEEAA